MLNGISISHYVKLLFSSARIYAISKPVVRCQLGHWGCDTRSMDIVEREGTSAEIVMYA